MPSFRTILFDLDGTLIDHFEAIHRSHGATLRHFGLPEPTMAQVRDAVGGGLEEAVAKLSRVTDPARLAELVTFYRGVWQQNLLVGVTLLPGARELLAELRDRSVTCAVYTNKHGPSARDVCAHLGVAPLLAGVFGALDTPWLKPRREFSGHVLQALGADATTTLLVGDSPWDVATGRAAGFPCWGVTTGTHDAAQLRAAGAARIFAGLPAVAAALRFE